MNKPLPPDNEKQIAALYQSRKQRHQVPELAKKAILQQAKEQASKPKWAMVTDAILGHMRLSVVYAALALAVVVLGMQIMPTKMPVEFNKPLLVNYSRVEIHSLDGEQFDAEVPSKERYRYNQTRLDTLMSQTAQVQEQQLLRVIKQDSGLSLVNCKDELIEISNEALALLIGDEASALELNGPRFEPGELVAISFNPDGFIVQVDRTIKTKQCS